MSILRLLLVAGLLTGMAVFDAQASCATGRATGDMGVVIERASGSLLVVEHSTDSILCRVEGLGDLSHASVVYSRDEKYAYIFGRDGGLTKVDIQTGQIEKRIVQGGNSIGGAISQSGQLIAVSNYEPGGVKVFSASDLSLVADIPAFVGDDKKRSKTVGLVDAPGERFIYSAFEGDASYLLDMSEPSKPKVKRFENIGKKPYDGLISADGRFYIAGLFGEDGLALLDLWQQPLKVRKILPHYGRGQRKFPVYKMPHLEGWAMTRDYAFLPAVGEKALLVVDNQTWQEVARIPLVATPVFAMADPTGRQIWVNFAFPDNQYLQVIDVRTLKVLNTWQAGKGVLHMEFTPRGDKVWVSVRDKDQIQIYRTDNLQHIKTLPAKKPSGIFFTARAHRIGL